MTTPEDTEAKVEAQQLLPGIPDEITLDHITPKLSFKALRLLSSVSCAWFHAIRTRQVHQSRISAHSGETFVLIRYFLAWTGVITLYCLKDNLSYELPPIQPFKRGTSEFSECVLLDWKVYVLAGEHPDIHDHPVDALFVLDLAGQWQWKTCASMWEQRKYFACAALNGEIYALGGQFLGEPVCDSEVYDPNKDRWDHIEPMPSQRFNHHALTLGEDIYVYGGSAFKPEYMELIQDGSISHDDQDEYTEDPDSFEIYDSDTRDWKVEEDFHMDSNETIFVAQGKFYAASDVGISVYEVEKYSWTHLYFHSFDTPEELESFWPFAVVAVEDELLAVIHWISREGNLGTCLARSRGFGGQDLTIVWEKVECSLSFPDRPDFSTSILMYPIQL